MTVTEALRYGAKTLQAHRCAGADAVRDAELLLTHATGLGKEALAMAPERRITSFARLHYMRLLARRARHAPVAHLTGTAWFAGREFLVSRHTLIPRPATETLLGAALDAVPDARTVVDVGTGSGAIAVTCALGRPDATVFATDISRKALRMARRNAKRLGVGSRISFRHDDLIHDLRAEMTDGPVLIIANLPYLPEHDRPSLDPDVLLHEPARALFGGPDGLDPSRRLIAQIAAWQDRPPVTVALELLPEQCDPLIRFAIRALPAPDAETGGSAPNPADTQKAGLSAGIVSNTSGTPVGVVLTVR